MKDAAKDGYFWKRNRDTQECRRTVRAAEGKWISNTQPERWEGKRKSEFIGNGRWLSWALLKILDTEPYGILKNGVWRMALRSSISQNNASASLWNACCAGIPLLPTMST